MTILICFGGLVLIGAALVVALLAPAPKIF
jgi:hypothetical protein